MHINDRRTYMQSIADSIDSVRQILIELPPDVLPVTWIYGFMHELDNRHAAMKEHIRTGAKELQDE